MREFSICRKIPRATLVCDKLFSTISGFWTESSVVANSIVSMPYYELMCIAKGHLSRRELGDLITKTARNIMSEGSVVTRIYALGANGYGPRKLAYPIRQNQVNHKTGYLFNICTFASPSTLKEISRKLGINESVLRFLAVRKDIMDAVAPPLDMDCELPPTSSDPDDPEHEMREFIRDYEKKFPEGQSIVAEEDERNLEERVKNDEMVQAVMNNLQSTTEIASSNSRNTRAAESAGSDMNWLLGYSKDTRNQ